MKKLFSLYILLIFAATCFAKPAVPSTIDYVKNEGQWEAPVLYKADLFGGWVFLEKNTLTYKFIDATHLHNHGQEHKEENKIIKGHVYKINWLNANPNVQISNEEKQAYYNNYFIGNDESKWKSKVGNYRTIYYNNIYPNIDFKLYSEATSMKSDYIIHKNGNVQNLQFKYDGINAMEVTKEGKLKLSTSINTIYELKPYAYQIIDGKQTEVACNYVLRNNILSFQLPNGYNKNIDLIIDPTLVFSSYSGSFSDNWGSSATHDNAGNMFLGGIALGSSYPTTTGAFQTTFGGGTGGQFTDIAITKFNATGTAKLYSTYLGGSANELLASLYCTANNELIAVMSTSSTNFPTTTNAYDRTFNGGTDTLAIGNSIEFRNGSDIVITKLNAAGSALIGSTYFGGSGNDGLNLSTSTNFNYGDDSRCDIAVDNSGNIYITSTTRSTNIPGTTGKAQPTLGGGTYDGVLAKFNTNLSSLNWSTYYGGSGADAAYSISLDKSNNILICGGTSSTNLPGTSNGLNSTFRGGSTDGFIAKFDNNGNSVLAATYLGTSSYDQAFLMDLDANDNVYIFGQSLGTYPVTAGVYSNTGAKQFIHKLNNNLTTTSFSTVFGSTNSSTINITPTALLVDVCNNIYAVGWGGAVNNQGFTTGMAVTNDAFKSTTDGSDFYLINFGANATNLIYATYFGENGGVGDHVDGGTSRFDKNGIVYQAVCASCGGSNSFPITNGVVGPNNNSTNCNMAGFKFNFNLTGLQIITASANPPSGCQPLTTSFTYTSTQPGTVWFWDFGDGSTSTSQFPNHTYASSGTYTVRFILRDPTNCNPVDSTTVTVTVGQRQTTTLNRTICQGQSVTVGQQTFSTNGTFNVTLRSSNGCDSVVTLNLVVNPTKTTTLNRTICQGQSVTVGNQTFNSNGTFVVRLLTSLGCDSTVTLNLNVQPNKTTTLNRTICQGQSVTVGQQTFSTNGTFTVSLLTSAGCDSVVTLNLNVTPRIINNLNRSICQGQSVIVGIKTYTQAGNYTDTLRTQSGCDSIVNLNLVVNPNKTTNISRSICIGQSVTIGNQTFSTTGNFTVRLSTSLGCDSIVNLALVVNQFVFTDLNRVVCTGISVSVGNNVYSQTGNYIDTLRTSAGCDSIIRLNLLVTDTIIENISRVICKGDSTSVANQIFTEPGNYEIHIPATDGCDSLINLSVVVIDTARANISRTICEGDSTSIGAQVFKEAGNYTILLEAASGCDSLVNLSVTVLPIQRTQVSDAICEGESYTIGNQTFSEEGNYTVKLSSSQGCDSIVNLTLTVNPLPVIDAISDKTSALSDEQIQLDVVTTENLSYNWIPINIVSNTTIQNPTAFITSPTWFIVTATNTQTECISVDSVFVNIEYLPCTKEYIYIPNAFSPNGDGVNDILLVRSTNLKSMHLEIFDRWGHKLFETDSLTEGWNGLYKGQPSQEEAYGYYFKGECIQGEAIELKGNITIIR